MLAKAFESFATVSIVAPSLERSGAAQLLSRKMLLDLRDALRAFLTLIERR